ncbi:hypothetical protein HJFPF1_01334 [Paramyrothecium foliicola]|nr:hypothetical protein HJFPF1_01334 [Paramyrothecium foliicola]
MSLPWRTVVAAAALLIPLNNMGLLKAGANNPLPDRIKCDTAEWLQVNGLHGSYTMGLWEEKRGIGQLAHSRSPTGRIDVQHEYLLCWLINIPHTSHAEMPSQTSNHRGGERPQSMEDDHVDEDRVWGDMRGRQRRQLAQHSADRVHYFVYAQLYEMNASHMPQESSSSSSAPPPPSASARPSTAGNPTHGPPQDARRASAQSLRQPNFTAEEQHYLHSRLPIRQTATAETAINHFRRLPFLYSDLAEGYRLRLANLPQGSREWQRRKKMAVLAQTLAERYRRFKLLLPRSYVEAIISRSQNEHRPSKFWESVLEEVERSNKAWAVVPFWVLVFVVQSSLVAMAFQLLPASAQIVLLLANGLAYLWSTTVMCEMLQARYVQVKTDEQELHDLMGGLSHSL